MSATEYRQLLAGPIGRRRGYPDIGAPAPVLEWGFNNALPYGAGDTATSWKNINVTLDGKWRRSFAGPQATIPTWAQHTASGDAALGIGSFWSIKPPGDDHAGLAAGNYDAQLTTFAAAATDYSYGTMYHEPEDNMTGPQFVAMFQRFYLVAKAANPTLRLGYAAMEYQWDLGRVSPNKTTAPDAWWPGANFVDWLGIDVYAEDWHTGHPPLALQLMDGFERWYAWAATKNKPLVIAEVSLPLERRNFGGGDPYSGTLLGSYTDSESSTWMEDAFDWAEGTGKFVLIMWWHQEHYAVTSGNSYVNSLTGAPSGHTRPLSLAVWNAHASS